jgi:putative transcriptional regulator
MIPELPESRGEKEPSRVFVVQKIPDAKAIRAKPGVSQAEFAAMLGISVRTLENWEQGHRTPKGPPRVLLQVAASHPEVLWEAVKPRRSSQRQADMRA